MLTPTVAYAVKTNTTPETINNCLWSVVCSLWLFVVFCLSLLPIFEFAALCRGLIQIVDQAGYTLD